MFTSEIVVPNTSGMLTMQSIRLTTATLMTKMLRAEPFSRVLCAIVANSTQFPTKPANTIVPIADKDK